jgi:putative oxidoreductase
MPLLTKINGILATIGSYLRSPLLLVIRLYWGWQFFIDGKGKLQNLDRVASYFGSLNIPMPRLNAMITGGVECGGGLLLLLGLFSRFVSPVLIGVMSVAYLTAEKDALHAIFSNPDKFLGADPFLFLYASVIVFAFGPGRISLDALIFPEKKA